MQKSPTQFHIESKEQQKSINENGIKLIHSGKDKDNVICEIMDAHPEDSFCFLNEGKLRERIALLQEYFLPQNPYRKIAYAVKANPRKKILEILADEGIDTFDCASANEIKTTLEVSPKAKILFNHPIKKAKDINFAAKECSVHHFTVQTHREIEKILENIIPFGFPPPVEIAVRLQTLNPKAKVNLSTKYGATQKDAQSMLQTIKNQGGLAPGISIHTGSQNTNIQSFERGIQKMTDLADKTGKIKTLNIGGGLPVNYFSENKFNIRAYLKQISQTIEKNLPDNLQDDPQIIIELGRAIIAEAIDLVIPVLSTEKRGKQKCVYFGDGVFTSFSDATVHDWKYNFKTIGKQKRKLSLETIPTTLFGQTCDSGDTLGEVALPKDLAEGDFIHVENAGAYLDSQSTHFNGFEPPKYILYNKTN